MWLGEGGCFVVVCVLVVVMIVLLLLFVILVVKEGVVYEMVWLICCGDLWLVWSVCLFV